MSEKIYEVPAEWKSRAFIDDAKYKTMYAQSIKDPNTFWAEQAKRIHWMKPFTKVKNTSYDPHNVSIKWFEDGVTNVSYNCVDRHLDKRGNQVAIIWESDDPGKDRKITYKELHAEVQKFANVLKARGVKRGDRVTIYLPMIPESAYAMLACTRIGAIHSVVFGGFSPDSLAGRIEDAKSTVVIVSDEGMRGGKPVPLKANADAAADKAGIVETMIVIRHTGGKVTMKAGRDFYYDEISKTVPAECACEPMNAEDPLFILYTSGSTGKPKGVLHTTAGYLVYTSMTHQYVFDYHDGDIYWCTADVGWVTGHSYIVYGPLCNGAASVMYEGTPDFPDTNRWWDVVERYGVTILYTAPTAIRSHMKWGPEHAAKHDLSKLRLLGSVGEPINPEAWVWYHEHIGGGRCPIVDTWWQTETGMIMITPLPGITTTKPGSATKPFPGVDAAIYNEAGEEVGPGGGGYLVLRRPWPAMLRGLYKEHDRYVDTYWSRYGDVYFAGDGARVDEESDFWLLGRVDDVMNVSGHRISTIEVESALVDHHDVAEAAVAARHDGTTGQAFVAFVTLKSGLEGSVAMLEELRDHVAKKIGP
ncbi:MAG: acetate--CoA ligase, partial [Xanthobacteraceae bacterium]